MASATNPATLISTFGGTSFRAADYGAINGDGIVTLKASSAGLGIATAASNAATQTDGGDTFGAQVVRGLVAANFIKGLGGGGNYTVSGFKRHQRHVGLWFITTVDPLTLSDGPGITISGVTFDPAMHIYQGPDRGNFSKLLIPCYKQDAYKSDTVIQVSADATYGADINLFELLGA